MSDTHQNGKGDTPRPLSVNWDTYASNWDLIFSKDKPQRYDETDVRVTKTLHDSITNNNK